jgi:hypothetical protein
MRVLRRSVELAGRNRTSEQITQVLAVNGRNTFFNPALALSISVSYAGLWILFCMHPLMNMQVTSILQVIDFMALLG